MVINQFWDDVKMDFDFFSLFSFHSRERFNPHKHTLSLFHSLSLFLLSLPHHRVIFVVFYPAKYDLYIDHI